MPLAAIARAPAQEFGFVVEHKILKRIHGSRNEK